MTDILIQMSQAFMTAAQLQGHKAAAAFDKADVMGYKQAKANAGLMHDLAIGFSQAAAIGQPPVAPPVQPRIQLGDEDQVGDNYLAGEPVPADPVPIQRGHAVNKRREPGEPQTRAGTATKPTKPGGAA